MSYAIDGLKPPFVPIGSTGGMAVEKPLAPPENSPFRELLESKLGENPGVRFSAHAQTRMESRNIELDIEQMTSLSNAVDQAKGKGGHNALVLMKDFAFIVNADNRTVITAMDKAGLNQNVFTNIDSAVVVKNENNQAPG